MSVLNKMKSLSAQKSVQWVARHVLVTEDFELRLQYLACVALAVAPEREPNSQERLAFNGLAASLSIDAADATEQLNERANVSEEDMLGLFAIIKAKEMVWIYLLDVAWLHAVDGEVDAHEKELMEAVAAMLGVLEVRKLEQTAALHNFVLAVNQKKKVMEVASLLGKLPPDKALQAQLPQLLKGCFPFEKLLHGRWVVHGDGTVTDAASGLMWAVNPDKTANFPNATQTMTWDSAMHWPKPVNEKGWCGHQDWRLPTKDELAALLLPAAHQPAGQSLHIWTDVFTDIPVDNYRVWTSSPYANNGNYAWIVNFGYGDTYHYGRNNGYYVRVVRSGQ